MQRREFGQLLRELRKAAHMSQEDLAERLDVSRTTITETENGRNVPKATFMEHAYQIFHSTELMDKYMAIQKDRKELTALASMMFSNDRCIAKQITKHVIRESFKADDLSTITANVFRLMMWCLIDKKKINRRMIDCVIHTFEKLDPDPERFVDLLDQLYDISLKQRSFDTFIRIAEEIEGRMPLDNRRLSQLYYQKATAHYYKGNLFKAYTISTKAVELTKGVHFQHTADSYNRHGLICMQIFNYDEALEYFLLCIELAPKGSSLYSLANQSVARLYYMLEDFPEAVKRWEQTLRTLDKDDLSRIHSLNDIVMMEIKLGHIRKAEEGIRECERLLNIAKAQKWTRYGAEHLLLRRNKVILAAVKSGNFADMEVSVILQELKETYSYLKDEYELTKNFILERMFLSSKLELST